VAVWTLGLIYFNQIFELVGKLDILCGH